MKKLFGFMFLMFVVSFIALLPAFGQPISEAPDDIIEWVGRFPEMIGSFWGLVVSVILLTPILIGVLGQPDAKKIVKYLITGLIATALILLSRFMSFGYLYDATTLGIIGTWMFVIAAQILGYAAVKDAQDAVAAKFNFWKKAKPPVE